MVYYGLNMKLIEGRERAETMCINEASRLLRHNLPKYAGGVAVFALLSATNREIGSIARHSYCFLRHVDDVIDGEIPFEGDPRAYVINLRDQIESGHYSQDFSEVGMAQKAISLLERARQPWHPTPQAVFLEAIDSMVFDIERREQRRALGAEELMAYHLHANNASHSLILMATGSHLAPDEIVALPISEGIGSSVRDIERDWTEGTINIPREVLEKTGLTSNSPLNKVLAALPVRKWFEQELAICRGNLSILRHMLNTTTGVTARTLSGLYVYQATKGLEKASEAVAGWSKQII